MSDPSVSVAVPLLNEESVLPDLLARTRKVLDALPGGPHEIVLVDDGSTDRTMEMLREAAADDARIVAVSLSRNFGHQAALGAALDYVSGDVVVVMDGDLQDAPEVIPRFLAEYAQGFDVVYAVRVNRKEGLVWRSLYSLSYRLIQSLANIRLPVAAGDFALMSRRVTDLLRNSSECNRYLRGLRTWVGFRQTGIPVERDARHSGRSKYSLAKLCRLAFDGVFSFSLLPLRVCTAIGVVAVAAAGCYAAYSLYAKVFLNQSPEGFTALILAIVFLSGVQLLFLGIIGEYIGRIYEEVKRRPHYVVDEVVGSPARSRVNSPG